MILQALYSYYKTLQDQEDNCLPREEYSSAEVSFEIYLSESGEVTSVRPYTDEKGKNIRLTFNVPKQAKRSGTGAKPYFLCDKADYLFGSALSMREQSRIGMQQLCHHVLQYCTSHSPEIRALHAFVSQSSEQLAAQLDAVTNEEIRDMLRKGGLCVLKYAPTGRFLHDDGLIKRTWERYYHGQKNEGTNDEKQMCLISGEMIPKHEIARLHPSIKNVLGAQSSGAAIVSFNKDSFCSYGRKQSYNAPASQEAADAYGYVLNKFLADPDHRIRMNDTTVVFWAETAPEREQSLFALLFQGEMDEASEYEQEDAENVRTRVKNALVRIQHGQTFKETFKDMDMNTRFYVLGLSPNAARLSVRFWYTGTLGEIGERMWQHYKDLSITGLDRAPTVRQLLREIAVGHDWGKIPPNMEGQLVRSILHGLPYSSAIFAQLINRIRSETDDPKKNQYKIGPLRAAMIKAYLIRKARHNDDQSLEGELTMSLNENSTSTPYHLGRLFACLEKTQLNALGQGINASIRDRFWGAASASPATVFPRLISLSRHHIAKDDKWGRYNDDQIQKVMNALPEVFPRRLTLEEQGMFALGYYHQRQSFYNPNQSKQVKEGTEHE
ncbi:type I-C CRISPR-associated protein Cas8c/Csd1 [Paenibacillus sp. FSL W8-0194]|uniref:type I-C CRISPR-associated protein Cas8c/Csd1 n=1 Tax=Paenibacillus sp. FSL W8-0194 TaxID=2921711 RepID=UPI0030DB49FE